MVLGQKAEDRCSNIIRNCELYRYSAVCLIVFKFGNACLVLTIYSGNIYFVLGFLAGFMTSWNLIIKLKLFSIEREVIKWKTGFPGGVSGLNIIQG